MTISTEVRKAGPFIGNDSASVFPFAFKVFKAADLIVVRRQDNIGEETTLILDSDYHVTLNGNQDTTPGGVVTLVAGALASGFTLVVSSELPYLQTTDLTNQGGFYPKVITNALDRLTIFSQQLLEITGRTLKLPITAPTNISAEIPLPNPSELIAWNETGTGLTTISPQSLVTSIAYGSATADLFAGDGVTTTFPLTTNPASVNNLDVSIGGHSQRPVQGGVGDYSWNGGASITFVAPPPAPTVPGDKNVLVRYMQAIPVSDSEALHAQTREALRRGYAEAGYNLVDGSFETGGTLTAAADVLLQESTGATYAWAGALPKVVAPGFDPVGVVGFELRTDVVLRSELASVGGMDLISGPSTALISDAPISAINGIGHGKIINGTDEKFNASSVGALSMSGESKLSNARVEMTESVNPAGVITGSNNTIDSVSISGDNSAQVILISDSDTTRLRNVEFRNQGYQIIQSSGHRADSVSISGCVSIDCAHDFVLANNDSQPGVSYDWRIIDSTANHKNSGVPYGATESRGIGFTSVYGGVAALNSMAYIKGDAATHLENIQESAFIGNYYRNNYCDLLFSGQSDRAWVYINTITGPIAVGDTINIGGTCTGKILFWYQDSRMAFIRDITGSFNPGDAYTTSGGASGVVRYADNVITHSGFIGNIFHADDIGVSPRAVSINLGVNNYTLRCAFVGNTHICQLPIGSNYVGVEASYSYGVSFVAETWRGYDTAIVNHAAKHITHIGGQYWSNTKHVNITNASNLSFSNERYYGGSFVAAGISHVSIEGCTFDGCAIDISSNPSIAGNRWSWNKVSAGSTLTKLQPYDFDVWESTHFNKRGYSNVITVEKYVTTSTPQKIATVTRAANNVCALVDFVTVWRNPATLDRGSSFGKLLVEWDEAGSVSTTPVGAGVTDNVTISVIGSGVAQSVDIMLTAGTGGTHLTTVRCEILAQGVTVSPVDFVDYY